MSALPPAPSPRAAHRPTRRALLLGALVGAVATTSGCGVRWSDLRLDDDGPVPSPTPDADELARRDAVRDADALRRAATAAATARPDLAALMRSVAQVHSAHLDALGAQDLAVETPSGSPTTGVTTTATTTATPGTDPVGDLVGGESAAASAALEASSWTRPGLARLLASVAAADAVLAREVAAALGQAAPAAPAPVPRPSGSAAVDLDDDAAAAVTEALEGEQAAVYGYGVAAARLDGARRDAARAALAEHAAAVEHLGHLLEAAGRDVPAPAPAYDVPFAVTDADRAVRLALVLEERTAARCADLVAAGRGQVRSAAADLLVVRALRAAAWRGRPVPLPGLQSRD
jgi:hypothetical protein